MSVRPVARRFRSRTLALLFVSSLAPNLAHAGDPPAEPELATEAVTVEPATEAVTVEPATTVEPEVAAEEPRSDGYAEGYNEGWDTAKRVYSRSVPDALTTLELSSGYFSVGIAPGMTLHARGFHPMTRFELEGGGTLEHEYRDLALSFGVVANLQPYYDRKLPSVGADVTATAVLGPIYLRTGLGALGFLPTRHRLYRTRSAVGGVVGVGLNIGRWPMIRVGVDYDLRVNTRLTPVHTAMVALRFACCRTDDYVW